MKISGRSLGALVITCILASLVLASDLGVINIFSEVKGAKIYLDDVFVGTDTVEVKDVKEGKHYIKALMNMMLSFTANSSM